MFVDSASVERLLIGVKNLRCAVPTLDARVFQTARKHRVPTVAQYCDTYDLADWMLFVTATGRRLGQTLGMGESDIDFDTATLTPRSAVREHDGFREMVEVLMGHQHRIDAVKGTRIGETAWIDHQPPTIDLDTYTGMADRAMLRHVSHRLRLLAGAQQT